MLRAGARWTGAVVVLIASFFGCYTGPHAEWSDPAADGAHTLGAEAGAAGAGATAGLPCEVEALLAARCTSCHTDPPTTAPMALVTYAQLTAKSASQPSRTVAEIALERMRDTAKPMPPANPLAEADLAAFASWVDAGAPASGCEADEIVSSSRRDAGPECVLASDCAGELICRGGTCDVECVNDKDCVPTWSCKATRCRPPAAVGGGAASPEGGASDGGASASFRDFGSSLSWSVTEVGALASGSYNGTAFDGRFVYFAPDGTNGKVLRFDTEQAFGASAAWSVFDLTALDARATGYRGAVFDGRYVYLVPTVGAGLVTARFDTQAAFASAASWTLVSLKEMTPSLAGFTGATFDGRYVYMVPAFSSSGLATRFDTHAAFTSASSWSTFSIASVHPKATSFAGAVFDGRYVYMVPWRAATTGSGVIARYDPQGGFSDAASWKAFDLTTLNEGAKGYHAAAFDGRYVYLVPGWTAPSPAWSATTLARYDTQAEFDSSGAWGFFELSALGPEAGGFNAAVFDGRYLVFAPGYADNGYRGDAFRFDTRAPLAQASSWSRFDATSLATSLVNTKGTAFDGRYVYLAPAGGVAARFDAKTPRSMPELPAFRGSFY
jgi:hypothetical protein